MSESVPILEQNVVKYGSRVFLTLKYAFMDVKKEITDEVTSEMLYYEVVPISCRLFSRQIAILVERKVHAKHKPKGADARDR